MEENGSYKISIENRLTRLEVLMQDIATNYINTGAKVDRLVWLVVTTLVAVLANFLSRTIAL